MSQHPSLAPRATVNADDLTSFRYLGRGGQGLVYQATLKRPDGTLKPCAVKILRPEFHGDSTYSRRFLQEASIHAQLAHGNVTAFLGFCAMPVARLLPATPPGVMSHTTVNAAIAAAATMTAPQAMSAAAGSLPLLRTSGSGLLVQHHPSGAKVPMCWAAVLEYMPGGNLYDLLQEDARSPTPAYTLVEALEWLVQIADALRYMHGHSPLLIHRDLKLENVMLAPDPNRPGHRVAKLGDFGLLAAVDSNGRKVALPSVLLPLGLSALQPSTPTSNTSSAASSMAGPALVSPPTTAWGATPNGAAGGAAVQSPGTPATPSTPPGAAAGGGGGAHGLSSPGMGGGMGTGPNGSQRALSQQGSDTADVDLIYAKLRNPASPSTKDEYLPEMYDMRFRLTGRCGSVLYMAPEVARGRPYNEKADVFSFAVLAHELLARRLVAEGMNHSDSEAALAYMTKVVWDGWRPPLEGWWDKELKMLLMLSWHAEPRLRPSFAAILARLQELQASPTAMATMRAADAAARAAMRQSKQLQGMGSGMAAAAPAMGSPGIAVGPGMGAGMGTGVSPAGPQVNNQAVKVAVLKNAAQVLAAAQARVVAQRQQQHTAAAHNVLQNAAAAVQMGQRAPQMGMLPNGMQHSMMQNGMGMAQQPQGMGMQNGVIQRASSMTGMGPAAGVGMGGGVGVNGGMGGMNNMSGGNGMMTKPYMGPGSMNGMSGMNGMGQLQQAMGSQGGRELTPPTSRVMDEEEHYSDPRHKATSQKGSSKKDKDKVKRNDGGYTGSAWADCLCGCFFNR